MQKQIALFNDTSVTRHFGCTAVMSFLIKAMEQRKVDIAYRWPVAVEWQSFADRIMSIPVDAIVVNGEGSIHHSRERPRARQLCELGPFAREHLKVPAFLVNASIEELEETEIENLKAFDFISVRETRSQAYLAKHGITSTVEGDFSFSSPLQKPRPRSGLLVTDSVYRTVTDELSKFALRNDVSVVSMRSKGPILTRIKRKFLQQPKPPLRKGIDKGLITQFEKFLETISGVELIVTGRFHSVCLGMLAHTPILAVPSNTDKISGILEDALGNTNRMISIADLTTFDLSGKDYQWTTMEKQSLESYLTEVRERQRVILDKVCA